MDTPTVRKKHYEEIDVAKGFALFLTVFGHVLTARQVWFNWIFSFHMPAFFFLSGMTFRPDKYPSAAAFFKDKFKKRIIPYFVITFIGLVICLIRPDYRAPLFAAGWKYELTWFLYYAQPKNLYIGQVWFLVGLFMAEVIFYFWYRLFHRAHPLVKFYSVMAMAWFGMNIEIVNGLFTTMWRLPWKMDMAWTAAVFMIAGYYTQKYGLLRKMARGWLCLVPVFIILNYYFGPDYFGYVNICDCAYSPGPFYFSAAFLGIFALCLVAVKLRHWRFWQFVGRYTLPLFAAQTLFIYLVVEIIYRFTGVWYEPLNTVTSDKLALMIAVSAFALMLLMIWPYHLWKTGRLKRRHP